MTRPPQPLYTLALGLALAFPANAQDPVMITTNPMGDPVVIQAGQILTLQHEAGDLPNITARAWTLLDAGGELIPGAPAEPEPIFNWVGHTNANPLFLQGSAGLTVQIQILEPGQYRIRLEAFGNATPGPITSSRAPGFILLGQPLTLTGPPGFNYQWKKDNAPLPGETTQTLILDPVSQDHAGVYTLQYDNGLSGKAIVETPPFHLEPLPPAALRAMGAIGLLIIVGIVIALALRRQ